MKKLYPSLLWLIVSLHAFVSASCQVLQEYQDGNRNNFTAFSSPPFFKYQSNGETIVSVNSQFIHVLAGKTADPSSKKSWNLIGENIDIDSGDLFWNSTEEYDNFSEIKSRKLPTSDPSLISGNYAPPANDNFANAINVTGLINAACTTGGTYTTVEATPDQSSGSCWTNGPNNNVWFKFVAPASGFISVQVKISGSGETMRNPLLAIFDAGLAQVACQDKQGVTTDQCLGTSGLTPGNTYYIAVDDLPGSNAGTFDLCLSSVAPATISYSGNPYCATGTASVTRTGAAGGTYSSTAGLVINAATGAIDLVSSTPGTYTVSYALVAGNCTNTATTSITINALPTVIITNPATACPPIDLTAAAVTAGSTAGLTYTYFTNAAGTIVLASPNAVTVNGTFYIKGTTAAGCSDIKPVVVTVNALPIATISYSGSPYCAIGTATVTQTGQGGGTYSSTAGLNITAATGTINLATSTPGTYTVTYTFTNGICSNSTTTSVSITALPVATFSYAASPYCKNAANPSPTFSGGGVAGTFSSTAGLVFVSTATGQINLAACTAGTYTVTNTIAAAGGCAAVTSTSSITITALPAATISYAGTPFCKTLAIAQPVTQTGTAGGTYSSTAGLTINAVTGAITPSTSTAGTYTVTYTMAAGGGCAAQTATTSVTITALPVATFSYAGTPYCQNAANPSPTFSGGGVAGTFSSTAGLVFVSTATGQINLAASTPGTYTVTNTIAAAGGCAVVTSTSSITITALPVATFSYAGTPYCQNAANPSPTFSGGGVAGTFSSTAGLVFVSTATGQINLAASTAGTYTVTNTIAAAGGCAVVTSTSSITITALPAATISYAGTPFCKTLAVAQPVTQTGTAGGTYSSTAGLTINAATGAITPSTSTAGIYTVTYTMAAGGGCAAQTATTSVTITALPVATFSYAGTPYCQNAANPSPTFSGGGVAGTFSSTAGLVFVSTATGQINLAASTPGTYTVTNTIAAAGGCAVVTSTSSITITALPVATFSYAGTPYCQNAANPSPTFSGGGVAGTFSSTAGLVFVSTATGQINLAASTAGTYTVTNTIAAAGGCAAVTSTSSITITALPAATISYAGTPFCKTLAVAQPVTQTGTAGGTYSSTAGLTINAATGAITPSTSTAGTYTVTYTMAAGGGCAAQTATTSVTITALPVATFSYAGTPYCQNAANPSPTFSGGGVAGTFSSTAGLVFVSTATGQINLAASTAGTYTVTNTIALQEVVLQ